MNICELSNSYFDNFTYTYFCDQGRYSAWAELRINELIIEDFTHLLC
jgi:hypothetical protein